MGKQFDKKIMIGNLKEKYQFVLENLLEKGVYIWGSALLGRFCMEQCNKNTIPVRGFIDSNANTITSNYINNISLFPLTSVSKDSIIIIANFYWYDLKTKLNEKGYNNFLYYEELALMEIGFSVYYMGFENLFSAVDLQEKEYLRILEYLNDEKSKDIYKKVLDFRRTLNVNLLKEAYDLSIIDGGQYFDKIIPLSEAEIFLDGGGFDGETSIQFIDLCNKKYKKIYFFEPDSKAMESAKGTLSKFENVFYFQTGIGQKCEKLLLDKIGNGASTVSESGGELIDIVNIDSMYERFTYIKLDIEGSECQALKGAEETINKYKPKLAISIYHHTEDLFKIFDIIYSFNPDYKFYIRHYTTNYADTVLYCV